MEGDGAAGTVGLYFRVVVDIVWHLAGFRVEIMWFALNFAEGWRLNRDFRQGFLTEHDS